MEVINFSVDPSFQSKPFLSVEAISPTESSYFLWKLFLLVGTISLSGNNSFKWKLFFFSWRHSSEWKLFLLVKVVYFSHNLPMNQQFWQV